MSLLENLRTAVANWVRGGKLSRQRLVSAPSPSLPAQKASPASVAATISPLPQIASAPAGEVLHGPLLTQLTMSQRVNVRRGMVVFHGCSSDAEHTDFANKLLAGTWKWVSEDAQYASDYARPNRENSNEKCLLWVLRLRCDVPGLQASQPTLVPHSPWGPQFPYMFPNSYEAYAQSVLGSNGPAAFLQYETECGYRELLITSPQITLEVLDVVEVPNDRTQARKDALAVAIRYLPQYRPFPD